MTSTTTEKAEVVGNTAISFFGSKFAVFAQLASKVFGGLLRFRGGLIATGRSRRSCGRRSGRGFRSSGGR